MKRDKEFNNLFEIIDSLKKEKRATYLPQTYEKEDVAQHSYELTMLVWYWIEKYSLDLDLLTCIQIALSHDLGEAICGDVSSFSDDRNNQDQRELEAIQMLEKDFPCWTAPLLAKRFTEDYTLSNESKFVKFCDRIVGYMVALNDDCRCDFEQKLSLQRIIDYGNSVSFPGFESVMSSILLDISLCYNNHSVIL